MSRSGLRPILAPSAFRFALLALLALWIWATSAVFALAVLVPSLLLYAGGIASGGRSRDRQDVLTALGDIPSLVLILQLAPEAFAMEGIVAIWLIAITLADQRRFRLPLLLFTSGLAWGVVALHTWLASHGWEHLAGQTFLIVAATLIGHLMLLERDRSRTDPLTGVRTRGPGLHDLQQQLRTGRIRQVAFVDLRGFKAINDNFGHQTGDEVLRIVGARLLGAIRTRDLVIRYGGDEFLVSSCAEDLKVRIARAVERPVHVAANVIPLRARIGVLPVEAGMGIDLVVQEADRRMYRDSERSRSMDPTG